MMHDLRPAGDARLSQARPILKVCGVTSLEDARYISGLLIDRIGFIFAAESPRNVDPNFVGAIVEWLGGIETVGVFVNRSAGEVNETAKKSGVDRVQLHGEEPPFVCKEIDLPVTKTLHVFPDTTRQDLQAAVDEYAPLVDSFLFDTSRVQGGNVVRGGTGQPFDWSVLNTLAIPRPFHLAGGLGAENLHLAWDRVRPDGFDVSGSVESSPGVKDFDKLDALLSAFHALTDRIASSGTSPRDGSPPPRDPPFHPPHRT